MARGGVPPLDFFVDQSDLCRPWLKWSILWWKMKLQHRTLISDTMYWMQHCLGLWISRKHEALPLQKVKISTILLRFWLATNLTTVTCCFKFRNKPMGGRNRCRPPKRNTYSSSCSSHSSGCDNWKGLVVTRCEILKFRELCIFWSHQLDFLLF